MAKVIGSCSNCDNDIEEDDLKNGTAEMIGDRLFCFDCAEKYRENLQEIQDNPGLDN